jgi:pyrroline-5-carboxylate reductase
LELKKMTKRLGFVGTGVITSAIVRGLAESGLKDWPVIVSPRGREHAQALAATVPSVRIAADNQAVVDDCDMVFLAIRPQIAPEVIKALTFRDGQTVVSLVAGVSIETLAGLIKANVSIIRTIPLPSVERRACVTPIMPPDSIVAEVFDALGSTIQIFDTEVFDGYVAGSAVMATYFGIVETAVGWLERNGLNKADADVYLRNLFGNLGDTLRSNPELTLDQLRLDHATRGGLNEMVHDRFLAAGGGKALETGLDAVLKRVRTS